ncbi:MAG: hypothetical protein HC881_10770 [Leptolyngbyaceae cyanobacterium SL_7_1]|nr:hypothetical protein [Leptolyngbyaceae cyanobacterium SL_7_1]
MSYQDQLNPWVIYQLLPDLNRAAVSRFRRRNEAEAYLRVISQLRPKAQFTLSFETMLNHPKKSQDPTDLPAVAQP